ncbi:hypothetical protein POVWA1_027850 [Plasmodium ovale wallikeri]|uniref:Uncharacterized protein n=1 Tax=Plasmodium ovale wallikeri TaxID=864142 RepID=A0A1A8YV32_PLAOA|nr:hypothetical protein POVWA1_027850 [Plasmodium ovale wallikeri]
MRLIPHCAQTPLLRFPYFCMQNKGRADRGWKSGKERGCEREAVKEKLRKRGWKREVVRRNAEKTKRVYF